MMVIQCTNHGNELFSTTLLTLRYFDRYLDHHDSLTTTWIRTENRQLGIGSRPLVISSVDEISPNVYQRTEQYVQSMGGGYVDGLCRPPGSPVDRSS